MMKTALLTLCVLLCATAAAAGQGVSPGVAVVKTYSENGKFYLRSVPSDNEFPTLRGKTYVHETGKAAPLYAFERGFDSVEEESNNLVLSDDGEVIFYVIPWGADEEKEGLKSVNVYRRGRLVRGYTETEVNGCDKRRERCSLLYENYDEVVDRRKSNWGTPRYRKVFKEGADEREKFLSDFAVFSSGGRVYLTDSKRRLHTFDLTDGRLVSSEPFDQAYPRIKGLARVTRTELEGYDSPTLDGFPRLRGGRQTAPALAAHLGMAVAEPGAERDRQYKLYGLKVTSTLRRDGSVEIEELEADAGLPREKVAEFFASNRFDARHIPRVFESWHLGEEYFHFRQRDARLARREKQEELARQRLERARRLTAERIEGVYVPRDLRECFEELDRTLPEVDRREMRALPKREGMIAYHLGLGTWMRNNWGLWGGSRLQKYFTDRGVRHPEAMSSVILYHYHDWLNGRRDTWREWEQKADAGKKEQGTKRAHE